MYQPYGNQGVPYTPPVQQGQPYIPNNWTPQQPPVQPEEPRQPIANNYNAKPENNNLNPGQPVVGTSGAKEPDMTRKDWLITLLVQAIPLVNIIMLFVWALGEPGEHPSRKNYAQAMLIMMVIIIGISIVFGTIIGSMMGSMMRSMMMY